MSRAQAIELARRLLPAWVGGVNVLVPVVAAFLIASVSTWSAGAIAARLVRDGPSDSWMDRARRDFPVRRAIVLSLLLVSMLLGSISSWFNGPLSPISDSALWFLVGVTSVAAGVLVYRRFSRRFGDDPPSAPGSWWRSFLVWLVVFWPSWLVAILMMTVIGSRFDARAAGVIAAGAVAIGFFLLGGGLLLLRGLGIARPPSLRLATIVEATSRRVGIRPRMIFELRASMANAFVFPVTGILVFTERALEVLDDDDVAAICAHELGHLVERRLVHAIRCLEAYLFLPLGALPLIPRPGAFEIVAVIAGVNVASFAFRRFRRKLEEQADRVAHAHEGEPGVYGRALERLYRANRVPVVLGRKRGTHPELYDRMVAASAAPSYPRPLPPPRYPTVLGVIGGTTVACLAIVALVMVTVTVDRHRHGLWYIALRGWGPDQLNQLGRARWEEGNHVDAIVFHRGAAVLARRSVFYATDLVLALARDGRCDEARDALANARDRVWRHSPREERRALRTATDAVAGCRPPTAS